MKQANEHHGQRRRDESALRALPGALAVVLALALPLSGCTGKDANPEETVTNRAEERWTLLLSGELATAYEYLSPGYRSSITSSAWQRKVLDRDVIWDGAEILGASCSEDACELDVKVDASVYGALPGVDRMRVSDTITENWALLDGQWYLVP